MKGPLKWYNQPGKKSKDFGEGLGEIVFLLEVCTVNRQSNFFDSFCCFQTLEARAHFQFPTGNERGYPIQAWFFSSWLYYQYTCTVLNLLFHWSSLICTSIVFRDRGIFMWQSLLFSQLLTIKNHLSNRCGIALYLDRRGAGCERFSLFLTRKSSMVIVIIFPLETVLIHVRVVFVGYVKG